MSNLLEYFNDKTNSKIYLSNGKIKTKREINMKRKNSLFSQSEIIEEIIDKFLWKKNKVVCFNTGKNKPNK